MRPLFLFLSRLAWLRRRMETSAAMRRLAARFVAGETLEDALATGRRLKAEGIAFTLDRLGESVTSLDEAAAARDEYLRVIQGMSQSGAEANVSLKLTQFGLDLSPDARQQDAAPIGAHHRCDANTAQQRGYAPGKQCRNKRRRPHKGHSVGNADGALLRICKQGIACCGDQSKKQRKQGFHGSSGSS